jgi:hypothetical protein
MAAGHNCLILDSPLHFVASMALFPCAARYSEIDATSGEDRDWRSREVLVMQATWGGRSLYILSQGLVSSRCRDGCRGLRFISMSMAWVALAGLEQTASKWAFVCMAWCLLVQTVSDMKLSHRKVGRGLPRNKGVVMNACARWGSCSFCSGLPWFTTLDSANRTLRPW